MLSSDYELATLKDELVPQHSYVDWVEFWQADYKPGGDWSRRCDRGRFGCVVFAGPGFEV